jgi:heptaprenyl diphosphate synthase
MKISRFTARKIATLAIFSALSLITFIIENAFPPLLIPGAKMGLSNIFSFAALILYSPLEGFIVIVVRTILGAFIVGNVSALMYSFTAGVVAMAISSLFMYLVYPKISIMSISILAAVMHNITQNIIYVLTNNAPALLSYMPYLALLGILSGAIVGGVIMLIFKKIPMSVFEKATSEKRLNGDTK